MVIGAVLAPSPPLPLVLTALAIFTLGSGFVGSDQVGRLYAAIGVVVILGSVT